MACASCIASLRAWVERTSRISKRLSPVRPVSSAQRLVVLRAGARGSTSRGRLRRGRALVPVERLEIVAHELLVEARRAGARLDRYRPARSARNRASALRRSASGVPSASTPNSNLVSAMMMPRASACAAANAYSASGRVAHLLGERRADQRYDVRRSRCSRRAGPLGLGRRREDRLRQPVCHAAARRAARCRRPRRSAGSPSSPSRSGSRARPLRSAAP